MDLQIKKDTLFIAATVILTYILLGQPEMLALWLPMGLMILVSVHKTRAMITSWMESRRDKRKFKPLSAKF